jgi:hypothetical protein
MEVYLTLLYGTQNFNFIFIRISIEVVVIILSQQKAKEGELVTQDKNNCRLITIICLTKKCHFLFSNPVSL